MEVPGTELRQPDCSAQSPNHANRFLTFCPGILKRGPLGEKRLGLVAGGFTTQRAKSLMVKLCSSMRKRL